MLCTLDSGLMGCDTLLRMADRSWTTNELKRLGVYIRDGARKGDFPTYDDVRSHYGQVAVRVQQKVSELDWKYLLGRQRFAVTSRAKTIDTLRDKLRRDRSTPLSSVQDIAGVRFEAEMSLSEQRAVAGTIARVFDHDPSNSVHDLLARPNRGYRALHVWLRLPERVEVQVRTQLQGAWANLYEELGDVVGRGIRYGAMPLDAPARGIVEKLQEMSLQKIAVMEESHDRHYLEFEAYEQRSRRLKKAIGSEGEGIERSAPFRAQTERYERQKDELRRYERNLHEILKELTENIRTIKGRERKGDDRLLN